MRSIFDVLFSHSTQSPKAKTLHQDVRVRAFSTFCRTTPALISGLCCLGVSATAFAQVHYKIVEIPIPAGYTSVTPHGINEKGVVVGSVLMPAVGNDGFIWDGTTMTIVPCAVANSTLALADINNTGLAVGNGTFTFTLPGGGTTTRRLGFIYDIATGTRTQLVTTFHPSAGIPFDTEAFGLNDGGDVGGRAISVNANNIVCPTIWNAGGGTRDLSNIGFSFYGAEDVNAFGAAATTVRYSPSIWDVGTIWQPGGTVESMPFPGGVNALSRLNDINDAGIGAGWREDRSPSGPSTSAVLYQNGIVTNLVNASTGTFWLPNAINNHNEVVGWGPTVGGGSVAAIRWKGGTATALQTLLPAGSGWSSLSNAHDVNDRGQIVGTGTLTGGGGTRAFLLTPVDVYVMSSGDATLDTLVVNKLAEHDLVADLGVQYSAFNGTQSITDYRAIYFQANANTASGDMPAAGQTALATFVTSGGGLVTTEMVAYKQSQGQLSGLAALLPAMASGRDSAVAQRTYTRVIQHPVLHAGLPPTLNFPADSFSGGTETRLTPSIAATEYDSSAFGAGVIGRVSASGRVLSISTTGGSNALGDPEFSQLLANALRWAGDFPQECPAFVGEIIDTPPVAQGSFFRKTASDGVRLAIAHSYDTNSQDAIALYAQNAGGVLVREATLSLPTGYSYNGQGLDILGDVLAVGTFEGDVLIYERVAGAWNPAPTHTLHPANAGASFGSSVALIVRPGVPVMHILIGEPLAEGTDGITIYPEAGGAHVYDCDPGTGQWTYAGRIEHPAPMEAGAQFGRAVEMVLAADTFFSPVYIISAPADDVGTWVDAGRVYALRRLGPGVALESVFTPTQDPGQAPQRDFGTELSADGDSLAISAHLSQSTLGHTGRIDLYRRVNIVNWVSEGSLTPSQHIPQITECLNVSGQGIVCFRRGDWFGYSTHMHAGILVASCPYLPGPLGPDQGGTEIFRKVNGAWIRSDVVRPQRSLNSYITIPTNFQQFPHDPNITEPQVMTADLVGDIVVMGSHRVDVLGLQRAGRGLAYRIDLTDCNANGMGDYCEIVSNPALDADGNGRLDSCGPVCDSIDFNNDGSLFDPQDIEAFLSVYSEGPCVPDTLTCNDIDFNNDGSVFDPCDINSFLLMYSEGPCTPCG